MRKVSLIASCLVLTLFLLWTLVPSLWAPYSLKEMFDIWLSPSFSHLLGTNDMGYDILTELIYGARMTLLIGLCGGVGSLILGLGMGIMATFKNIWGTMAQGLINIMTLLPKMVVLIVLAVFLPHNTLTLIILIISLSWMGMARETKAKVETLYHEPFMDSMTVLGYSKIHIVFYHLIPNLKDIIVTRLLLGISSAIMLESSLSFLGLGDTYHPSWGTMMNFAYKRGAFFREAYAYLLAPGLCISVVALAIYGISSYLEHRHDIIINPINKEEH